MLKVTNELFCNTATFSFITLHDNRVYFSDDDDGVVM